MINKSLIKAPMLIVASLTFCAGIFSPLSAQPNNTDLLSAAKQLGLIPAQTPQTQQKQLANSNSVVVARKPQTQLQKIRQNRTSDPYAKRRLQIHKQNIARRQAHNNRITQQRQQLLRNRQVAQSRYVSNSQPRSRDQVQQKRSQESHKNVWNRIYQGFRIRDYNNKPLVKRFTKSFSKNPARIQQLADRSSDYLYMVVNELNRRNMPTEIALLPFVESAYKNEAYSHAGAAGMWQFIPATGRRFGLNRTRSYDARLDPIKATKAALSYLQTLNRQFKGDWLLSLAAYNCGEFRVHREIANNKRRGLRTDYWSLNLPRETRQYVPRLLAFKEIFRNPRAYRVHLRGIPNHTVLTSVRVNKAVDLRKAAATVGLPANTLTTINSSFLHGITTPRISNEILLPSRHASRLTQAIHRLPAAKDVHNKYAYQPTKRKKRSKRRYSKKSRYRYVRVKSGDNLYQIARKHGTTVKKLKRINKLRSNKIWPGRRLKVTTKSKRKKYS